MELPRLNGLGSPLTELRRVSSARKITTDAIKVYAGPNVLRKDMEMRELYFGVLQHEVQAVEPVIILAFGADAKYAFSSASIDNVLAVPHPTSRGIRGSLAERLDGYKSLLGIDR